MRTAIKKEYDFYVFSSIKEKTAQMIYEQINGFRTLHIARKCILHCDKLTNYSHHKHIKLNAFINMQIGIGCVRSGLLYPSDLVQ